MIFKDYYKILELDSNKATNSEIKIAYRELAKKYHPDIDIKNAKAEEHFKDINEAYKVLSTTSTRRKYDRMWNTYIGRKKKTAYKESKRTKGEVFSDFFNIFFGPQEEKEYEEMPKRKLAEKGENVETEINITLEEAFFGKEKAISLRRIDGKMKTFKVKIPAGIQNKEKIRLINQGLASKNGGQNGDLFIKVNIENNDIFALDGYNLKTNLPLTPWEAALSTKVSLRGISEELSLYIPSGTQSGDKFTIPNKGYKDGKGSRGDLIVEAKIMIPKTLKEEEKALYKKMKEISKFNPRNS